MRKRNSDNEDKLHSILDI